MEKIPVKLKKSATKVSLNDIKVEIGMEFQGFDYFCEFYSVYNGGIPNKNVTSGDSNFSVRHFNSIKYRSNDYVRTIAELTAVYLENAPLSEVLFFENIIIFAEDEGGNIFAIRKKNGEILYIPFDVYEGDLESDSYLIASSFKDFIFKLEFYSKVFDEDDFYDVMWNSL